MSQRAAALADAFESLHVQVVRAVTDATPEQWGNLMTDEQWPAGFGFYHLAEGYSLVYGWIDAGAAGPGPVQLDPAANDAANARCLAAHRDCERQEVLGLLNARGQRLAERVRGLTDEQLAKAAIVIPDGTTRSVEEVASGPMLGHLRMHMASITAASGLGQVLS
jgi:hypothetical protein